MKSCAWLFQGILLNKSLWCTFEIICICVCMENILWEIFLQGAFSYIEKKISQNKIFQNDVCNSMYDRGCERNGFEPRAGVFIL